MEGTPNIKGPFKVEYIVTMMGEQKMHHAKIMGEVEPEGQPSFRFPFIVSMVSDHDPGEIMSKAELELIDVRMRFAGH